MKKKILCGLLAAVMMFTAGCGENTGTKKGEVNMNEEIELLWYLPCTQHSDAERVFARQIRCLRKSLI